MKKWYRDNKDIVQNKLRGVNKTKNLSLSISEDYKELKLAANLESGDSVGPIIMGVMPSVCMLQILNGVNPSDMRLKMHFSNIDTGNTVWQGTIPVDGFELSAEDWDV